MAQNTTVLDERKWSPQAEGIVAEIGLHKKETAKGENLSPFR